MTIQPQIADINAEAPMARHTPADRVYLSDAQIVGIVGRGFVLAPNMPLLRARSLSSPTIPEY
jgi:hypothetical protein